MLSTEGKRNSNGKHLESIQPGLTYANIKQSKLLLHSCDLTVTFNYVNFYNVMSASQITAVIQVDAHFKQQLVSLRIHRCVIVFILQDTGEILLS